VHVGRCHGHFGRLLIMTSVKEVWMVDANSVKSKNAFLECSSSDFHDVCIVSKCGSKGERLIPSENIEESYEIS
jgi:hypothetical protein